MDEEYIGVIKLFAGNFAPRGYEFCAGQILPISNNEALYSIIGTTYGGDGKTTFALPDLRGRVPVGQGKISATDVFNLGTRAGDEQVTLTVNNLPPHTHQTHLSVSSSDATEIKPSANNSIAAPGTYAGREFSGTFGFNTQNPDTVLNQQSVKTDFTGGGLPINNMQPYLALNYIICVYGIYPSKNDY